MLKNLMPPSSASRELRQIKQSGLSLQVGFGIIRSVAASIELFRQGDSTVDVFLIVSGAVKLTWTDPAGDETILALRWPGCFLGGAEAINGRPYIATAVTLVSSILERMTAESFSGRIWSDKEFNWRVHQNHSMHVSDQLLTHAEIACLPARRRLESFLRRIVISLGESARAKDGRLILPLKKQEIAQLVAIDPSTLSRLLTELSRDDVVRLDRQWIIVPDVGKLKQAV
jgi:CRP/FNR family transcriptional regulator, cyclic AMP receptor protein